MARPTSITCEWCSSAYSVAKNGPVPNYCGVSCRKAAEHQRKYHPRHRTIECARCGGKFRYEHGGLPKNCPDCRPAIRRERKQRYSKGENAKQTRRRWRAENPERWQQIQRRNALKRLYGITPEQYEVMLAGQGGVCMICGNPPTGNGSSGNRLHVDHDHPTGAVRGLLCTRCNQGLGSFRDDPALLTAAAKYLTS